MSKGKAKEIKSKKPSGHNPLKNSMQQSSIEDVKSKIAALMEAKKKIIKDQYLGLLSDRNDEIKAFFDSYATLISRMEQLDKDIAESSEEPAGSLKLVKQFHDMKTKEIYERLGIKSLAIRRPKMEGESRRGRTSHTIEALSGVITTSADKRWKKDILVIETIQYAKTQGWSVTRDQVEAILKMRGRYSKIGFDYDRGIQEFYVMK
jgi:hypothetical protein